MNMEIKVLGLSGKKQSGKNTAANYIIGCFLKSLEIIRGDFKITDKGELWVPDIFGDAENECVFDVFSEEQADFRKEYLDDIVKVYSFADTLKEDICMKVLGLTRGQCYGTDEQKNALTHLNWEDMPGVVTKEVTPPDYKGSTPSQKVTGRLGKYYDIVKGLVYHEPGPMTAREVMQFVGTEIFRKMYGNVWVDATMRKIKQDRPMMAIVTDVRFVNEVEGIVSLCTKSDIVAEGKILRLTRDVFKGQDQHESETALDDYDFGTNNLNISEEISIPLDNPYLILDNQNMSVEEQNVAVHKLLENVQWLPKAMQ